MAQSCVACGKPLKAKNTRRKYCNDTCRGRAYRAGVTARETRGDSRDEAREEIPTVTSATRRALEAAEVLDTPAGAAALVLAAKLDQGGDTGSAVAAMIRELRATVAEATANAKIPDDPLDEIAQKRKERRLRAVGA